MNTRPERFETRQKVTAIHRTAVVTMVDLQGTGRMSPHAFEADVGWVFETDAKLRWMHGGVLLDDAGGFSDYYGFGKSMEAAVEQVGVLAERYAVDTTSSLSLEIDLHLVATPVLADTMEETTFGRLTYQRVPSQWHVDDGVDAGRRLQEWRAGRLDYDKAPRRVDFSNRRPLFAETAWTTKMDTGTNEAKAREVVERFTTFAAAPVFPLPFNEG